MKIFHIVENLDKGAVENWLIQVFKQSRALRPEWQWTFYCLLNRPGRLDESVRKAGGIILYSPVSISQKFSFLKQLRATLLKGSYDILHVHHDFLSGFYLPVTLGIPFKQRILHIHNNDQALPVGNPILHTVLLNPLKWLGYLFSDTLVGISKHTLSKHVGQKFKYKNLSQQVLYYGIDLTVFKAAPKTSIRQELMIPDTAKLLLFVGRMNEFKNPLFVLAVATELAKTDPHIYTVFIGAGELEQPLHDQIKKNHMEGQTRVLGWRDDTAMIMKQSDLFLFPRLEVPKEGLGLVVVEAQAAGLPMLTTQGIVDDAIVIPELVQRLPLDVTVWVEEVKKILNQPQKITKAEALAKMEASCFELGNATQQLIELYERPL